MKRSELKQIIREVIEENKLYLEATDDEKLAQKFRKDYRDAEALSKEVDSLGRKISNLEKKLSDDELEEDAKYANLQEDFEDKSDELIKLLKDLKTRSNGKPALRSTVIKLLKKYEI
jgi:hypothetical protein